MLLDTKDRIILLSILPQEGDVVMLRLLRELKQTIGFSDEEIERLGLSTTENGRTVWDEKAERLVEVDLGETALSIIKREFRKLNKEQKVKDSHLETYDKFIDDTE